MNWCDIDDMKSCRSTKWLVQILSLSYSMCRKIKGVFFKLKQKDFQKYLYLSEKLCCTLRKVSFRPNATASEHPYSLLLHKREQRNSNSISNSTVSKGYIGEDSISRCVVYVTSSIYVFVARCCYGKIIYLLLSIYKSRVTVFVASNLRNGWIIFNETLHTPYGGMRIGFKTHIIFRSCTKINLLAIFLSQA